MALRDLIPWGERKRTPMIPKSWESPVEEFHHSLDRFFERAMSDFGLRSGLMPDFWGRQVLRVDVAETDVDIVVSAEIPGMEERDFDLSLTREALIIRGEKREESREEGAGLYRMERSFGTFERAVPLPCEVDPGKVEATYKKGILKVRLPKTVGARKRVRKIDIT